MLNPKDLKTIQDLFYALFDEFGQVSPAKVAATMQLASTRVGRAAWGEEKWPFAVAYITAHMLALNSGVGGGGGAGPVVSETVGEMSRTYATVGAGTADELYFTTKYGQLYVQLRRETIVGASITRGPFPLRGVPYTGYGDK